MILYLLHQTLNMFSLHIIVFGVQMQDVAVGDIIFSCNGKYLVGFPSFSCSSESRNGKACEHWKALLRDCCRLAPDGFLTIQRFTISTSGMHFLVS
jgi:hypothetical protein